MLTEYFKIQDINSCYLFISNYFQIVVSHFIKKMYTLVIISSWWADSRPSFRDLEHLTNINLKWPFINKTNKGTLQAEPRYETERMYSLCKYTGHKSTYYIAIPRQYTVHQYIIPRQYTGHRVQNNAWTIHRSLSI